MSRHPLAARRNSFHSLFALLALLGTGVSASSATARVLFDFEGPFLGEQGKGLKDHALVFDGTRWHCFYIRGVAQIIGTRDEISLGHATSSDLRNWQVQDPILEVVPGTWESRSIWAPAVLPNPGGGWTMFYTGVEGEIIQRMGRADSSDLFAWQRHPDNPLLVPDSQTYLWSPTEVPVLSVFRDPFLFEKDGQYHVLNSVLLRDATAPLGYRGAIHHATSSDLVSWTAQPTFAVNNFPSAVSREIESVQLVEAGGGWNLFFTLFGVTGVQWVRSDAFEGPWLLGNSVIIDGGNAAEFVPVSADRWLFTRYAVDYHTVQHPKAAEPFFVIRTDSLTFDAQGQPQILPMRVLENDWPVRTGTAFSGGITFGDNSLERGEPSTLPVGHGYLSSREAYDGPLGNPDEPGDQVGPEATGTIASRWFTVEPNDVELRFQIAGTDDPDCRVELVELIGGTPENPTTAVRRTQSPLGTISIRPATWDLSGLQGATVRLEVTDASTTGWILLDHIEKIDQNEIVVSAPPVDPRVNQARLRVVPNPFNPRTRIEFELPREASVRVEIFDTLGRRVLARELGVRAAGGQGWSWEGTDDHGRPVASGVYRVIVRAERYVGSGRAVLVR